MKVTRRQLRNGLLKIIKEAKEGDGLTIIPATIESSGDTRVINLSDQKNQTTSPRLINALLHGVKTSQGAKLGDLGEEIAMTVSSYKKYFGDQRIVSVENTNEWQEAVKIAGQLAQPTGAGDSFGIDLWASLAGGGWTNPSLLSGLPGNRTLDLTSIGIGISMKLSIATSSGSLNKQDPSFKNKSGIKKMMDYLALQWILKNFPTNPLSSDFTSSRRWQNAVKAFLLAQNIKSVKANIDAINGSFNPIGILGRRINVTDFRAIGALIHDNIFAGSVAGGQKLAFDLSRGLERGNSMANQGKQNITISNGVTIAMGQINAARNRHNQPRDPLNPASTALLMNAIDGVSVSGNNITGPRDKLILLGHYIYKAAHASEGIASLPVIISGSGQSMNPTLRKLTKSIADPDDETNQILAIDEEGALETIRARIETDAGLFRTLLEELILPAAVQPEFWLLKMSPNNANLGITETLNVSTGDVSPDANGLSTGRYQNVPKAILKLPPVKTTEMAFTKLLDSSGREVLTRLKDMEANIPPGTTGDYISQIFDIQNAAAAALAQEKLGIKRSLDIISAADLASETARIVANVSQKCLAVDAPERKEGQAYKFALRQRNLNNAIVRVETIYTFIDLLTVFQSYFGEASSTGRTKTKFPKELSSAVSQIFTDADQGSINEGSIKKLVKNLQKLNRISIEKYIGTGSGDAKFGVPSRPGAPAQLSSVSRQDITELKTALNNLQITFAGNIVMPGGEKGLYKQAVETLLAIITKIESKPALFSGGNLQKIKEHYLKNLAYGIIQEENMVNLEEENQSIIKYLDALSSFGMISAVALPFGLLEPSITEAVFSFYEEQNKVMENAIEAIKALSADVFANEPNTLDDLGTTEKEGEAQGVFDKVKEKLGSYATGAIDYIKDFIGKGKSTLEDLISLPPQPAGALTEGEKLAYKAIIREAKKRKKEILVEQNNRLYANILKEILKRSK